MSEEQKIAAAVAAEREACAKIAEECGVHPALNVAAGGPDWYKHGKAIALAIRARGTEDWQQRAAAAFAKDYKEGL